MFSVKELLSQLTYGDACRYLGETGEELLKQGGQRHINLNKDISRNRQTYLFNFADAVLRLSASSTGLQHSCSHCLLPCEHLGAALATILEEKEALGLSQVGDQQELIENALKDRQRRAQSEAMTLHKSPEAQPWGAYKVSSKNTGKSYLLRIYGLETGESFCTCPDFKNNTLGTCKHIIFTHNELKKKPQEISQTYDYPKATLQLSYFNKVQLQWQFPSKIRPATAKRLKKALESSSYTELTEIIQDYQRQGVAIELFPDASDFIKERLFQEEATILRDEVLANLSDHPLRKNLLRSELLPYQLEGAIKAFSQGRAMIADAFPSDTQRQAIATAELFFSKAKISKVLYICRDDESPAIEAKLQKVARQHSVLIHGNADERSELYGTAPYTICSFQQLFYDYPIIDKGDWDLIILDHGESYLRDWESASSKILKSLRSRFALAITTPESLNDSELIFALNNFVDARRLGPAFRFFHPHHQLNPADLKGFLAEQVISRSLEQFQKQLPVVTHDWRSIPSPEALISYDRQEQREVLELLNKSKIDHFDIGKILDSFQRNLRAASELKRINPFYEQASPKWRVLDRIARETQNRPVLKAAVFCRDSETAFEIKRALHPYKNFSIFSDEEDLAKENDYRLLVHFELSSDYQSFIKRHKGIHPKHCHIISMFSRGTLEEKLYQFYKNQRKNKDSRSLKKLETNTEQWRAYLLELYHSHQELKLPSLAKIRDEASMLFSKALDFAKPSISNGQEKQMAQDLAKRLQDSQGEVELKLKLNHEDLEKLCLFLAQKGS